MPKAVRIRGGGLFRPLRENPPDAILIDLMRMPSYGRMTGAMLREQKGTRRIPLVFLAGDPEKTPWCAGCCPMRCTRRCRRSARRCGRRSSSRRESRWCRVREIPVVQKLRIGKDSVVGLVNAPAGFGLGKLPAGAKVQASAAGADIILIFVKSAAALGGRCRRWRKSWSPAGNGGSSGPRRRRARQATYPCR